jgi:hypothetical protein
MRRCDGFCPGVAYPKIAEDSVFACVTMTAPSLSPITRPSRPRAAAPVRVFPVQAKNSEIDLLKGNFFDVERLPGVARCQLEAMQMGERTLPPGERRRPVETAYIMNAFAISDGSFSLRDLATSALSISADRNLNTGPPSGPSPIEKRSLEPAPGSTLWCPRR